ncbi:MAG: DUF4276 family protein [Candidatus Margulisbacteria bacterium]|nr:DUF4276 family protein [Candidatus Margulisiibacteriota bacterium]
MIELTRTLFLIDGPTERESFKNKLQKEYKSYPEMAHVNCNGEDVSAHGYAIKATSFISHHFRKRCKCFICILDYEGRKGKPLVFAEEIKKEITRMLRDQYKLNDAQLLDMRLEVCVADKTFENWIVADIEGIKIRSQLIKSEAEQKLYDGKKGETILKGIMKTPYSKVIHAPMLFKAISFRRAASNSPSFNTFVLALR